MYKDCRRPFVMRKHRRGQKETTVSDQRDRHMGIAQVVDVDDVRFNELFYPKSVHSDVCFGGIGCHFLAMDLADATASVVLSEVLPKPVLMWI